MKIDGQWMLCTVEELGAWLAEYAGKDVLTGEKNFPDCDFTIADQEGTDNLNEMARNASGWYGIKAINAGFDSDRLLLVADYYGGGGASMCTVGESDIDVAEVISDTILEPLQCAESATKETVLLVEFLF